MKIKLTYNIIAYILISVLIATVLCTVFSTNNFLGNGTLSGKYFWFYASMAILSIVAGINVVLNDSPGTAGWSLGDIEALSGECSGCPYVIKSRECYKDSDITSNDSSGSSHQICPGSSTTWCPGTKWGHINSNASSSTCTYKSYY
jgi:hypothetical protein